MMCHAHVSPGGSCAPYAQAKIDRLAADWGGMLEDMKQLTVTQAEYEAMENELEKEVEAKDILEVSKLCLLSPT